MKIKLVLISLIVMGILALGLTTASQAANPAPTFMQVSEGGFGDVRNNQITALEMYNGYLYAAAHAYIADFPSAPFRGQVWRSADGKNWEMVRDTQDNSVRDFAVFQDYLYASHWNGKIVRTLNGVDWEDVSIEGYAYAGTGFMGQFGGFMTFSLFKGYLYANSQVQGPGGEIWRTLDGLHWEQVVSGGFTATSNSVAQACDTFKGYLYCGTQDYEEFTAELWRTDGVTMEVVPTAFSEPAILNLTAYGDMLYARVLTFGGCQTWRSANGLDWEHVPGLDFPGDFTPWMTVYQGSLYLLAHHWDFSIPPYGGDRGVEVYRTQDGLDWTLLSAGGFGDANNGSVTASASFKGRLYLGVNNPVTGAAVWMLCEGTCK